MRKIFLYSLLLIAGLIASQFLRGRGSLEINLLTMFCLSFIMIRVGYSFELSLDRPKQYAWDFVVAMTTTVFPWIFCALYFVFVMAPPELWWSRDLWWEALLAGRFAAPTSVGILFPMLAAAGLTATWLFRKARVLAIADDLDTLVLLIPLKLLVMRTKVQLVILVFVFLGLAWVAWKYMHVVKRAVKLPVSWPWLMLYSAIIVVVSEVVNLGSKAIDNNVPIHLEVLLPAFILGCALVRPPEQSLQKDGVRGAGWEVPEGPQERLVAEIVTACFMALVGLSIPPIAGLPLESTRIGTFMEGKYEGVPPEVLARKMQFPGWDIIAIHVLIITVLSNIGKMFPAIGYWKEAARRECLALSIGMFPRGEVGAGVLVVSLSYGVAGPMLTVAVLSLALNLLCSGLFVLAIRRLVVPRTVRV